MNAHAHTHTHGWLNDIYHAEKCSCYRSNRTKWGVKLYMRLIRVDSACSSSHTVMLRGPLHSVVDLTMASKSTGNAYNIRVLRHRYHEFDLASSVAAKRPVSLYPNACFAGLEVTEQPQHAVVAIDDLVDNRFVKQGDPGYSNPIVHVGDRILAVDGRPAEHVSVQELHGISLL